MDINIAGLSGRRLFRGQAQMPATPLTRLNYFDGLFLRAELLRKEQDGLRNLVFQSNVASGRGVAFGLDVTWDKGTIGVQPGLAVDGQGRLLLLVDGVAATLADLLSPGGSGSKGTAGSSGTAGRTKHARFELCAEKEHGRPGGVAGGTSYYAVTLCYGELLCGWEEVRGRACEDACDAGMERTYIVDQPTIGLCPVTVKSDLPKSTAVLLGEHHLRSRVASALFADERDRALSLIRAQGLHAEVWCHGAVVFDEPCGDCVPLALLAVRGQTKVFLDPWIVRRERMETPPQRYWAGRVAMRPWDVYLAQVLQFQCQLSEVLGGLTGAEGSPPGDPCADTRGLLGEALGVLDRLNVETPPPPPPPKQKRAEGDKLLMVEDVQFTPRIAHIADLAQRVRDALAAGPGPRKILLDGGIVELPPAGWLPIDPKSDTPITRQVADLLGPGLDLRFCAVRADQAAEEFESCRHMDRISLVHGLDDPTERQQVDILVPDANAAAAPVTGRLFSADVVVSSQSFGPVPPGTLRMRALGSDHQLPLQGLLRVEAEQAGPFALYAALAGGVASARTAVDTSNWVARVIREGTAEKAPRWRNAVVGTPRMLKVLHDAAAHRQKAHAAAKGTRAFQSTAAQGEGEPLFVWLEIEADANPFGLGPGQSGTMTLRYLYYSPAGAHVVDDASDGPYTLKQHLPTGGVVVTFTPTSVTRDGKPAKPTPVDITIDVAQGSLTVETSGTTLSATWSGTPVSAHVKLEAFRGSFSVGADLAEREQPEASDQYHTQAVGAISAIDQGAGVSGFAADANAKLFAPSSAPTSLSTALDWVLFRRRTRRDCTTGEAPPVPDTTVLAWQTVTEDPKQAEELGQQLKNGIFDAVWHRVGPIVFTGDTAQLKTPATDLQKAWRAAQGGSQVTVAAYAPVGAIAQPAAGDRLRSLLRGLPPAAAWTGTDATDLKTLAHPEARYIEAGDTGVVFLVSLALTEKPPQAPTAELLWFVVPTTPDNPAWQAVVKSDTAHVLDAINKKVITSVGVADKSGGAWDVGQIPGLVQGSGADVRYCALWAKAEWLQSHTLDEAKALGTEIVDAVNAELLKADPQARTVNLVDVVKADYQGEEPLRMFFGVWVS